MPTAGSLGRVHAAFRHRMPATTEGDYATVRLAVAQAIRQVIGADGVLWTEVTSPSGRSKVYSGDTLLPDAELTEGLCRHAFGHPAVASYLQADDDGTPRRISDVTSWREWSATPIYAEVFRPRDARFQLSIVTSLDASGGRGWVLTRGLSDFSDRDVDIASAMLPLLAALESGRPGTQSEPQNPCAQLTAREMDILCQLTSGTTARAIGRASGISEGTVRKHLEHIYRKLGANDRITAVIAAQKLGILDE